MLQPWWISSCCFCVFLSRRGKWCRTPSWWGSWTGSALLCWLWVTAPLGLHPAWSSPTSLTSSLLWPSAIAWWSPHPASLDTWWVDDIWEACHNKDLFLQNNIFIIKIICFKMRAICVLFLWVFCWYCLNWVTGFDLLSVHDLLSVRAGGMFKLSFMCSLCILKRTMKLV